jgi:hypothetical protein
VVNVQNLAPIATTGHYGDGIVAQSIGGGGGLALAQSTHPLGLGSSLALGADGAFGVGGAVTVSNSAGVSTQGVDSFAVLAQSIGGGGGSASLAALLGSIGGSSVAPASAAPSA